MAAKKTNGDSNQNQKPPLTYDQFSALMNTQTGTTFPAPDELMRRQYQGYLKDPTNAFQSMTSGGSFIPNSPGSYGAAGHGQAGPSGGYIQGGIPMSQMADLMQSMGGQQPQQQQQQPQMPQLAQRQPTPTVQTTPLTPTAQSTAATPAATTMNVPQASAANTTPLFSLGQQPQMPQAQNPLAQNPLMQQPQQIQRFQGGGQVQDQSSSGMTDPFSGQPLSPQDQAYANLGLYHAYPQGSTQQNAINAMGSPTQAAAMYQPTLLGAAATQSAPIINLPPSGDPSSKSGVAPTPGAIVGTGVPQIPQGPWLTNPSVFAKAAMPTLDKPVGWTGSPTSPLTPTAQANAAQMPQQPITPAANAATATPTQLAQAPQRNTDTVPAMLTPHEFVLNQQATAALGPQNLARFNAAAQGMPPAAPGSLVGTRPAPPAGGLAAAPAPQSAAFMEGFQHGLTGAPPTGPSAVKRAQTGGYVYPQDQQQQVLRMQTGGYVTPGSGYAMEQQPAVPLTLGSGYETPAPSSNTVENNPNVSRAFSAMMGWPMNPWHPDASPRDKPARIQQSSQSQQQTQQQPSQQPTQQPQTAPQAPPTMQAPRGGWNAANSAYSGGASGGGYYSPEGYVGASPGPGQTGYIYPNQQAATAAGDVGTGVSAPGGVNMGKLASGIGSALTDVANKIAASTPPWRWINPVSMGNTVAPPPAPITFGEVRT